MHRSGLCGFIIDCKTDDIQREARFWSGALGFGIAENPEEDGKYVYLDVPEGRPYIELQAVDHPSRVHMDLRTDDLEAEVARLENLGATVVERIKQWCVMEAPSGQRFCVIQIQTGRDLGPMNEWP